MSLVRDGDAIEIVSNMGFTESPYKSFEWTKTYGDHKFFIYYSRLAWRLELVKYGTDGVGEIDLKYKGAFESLYELRKIYRMIIKVNKWEENRHG